MRFPDEKPCREGPSIGEHAQDREEVRHALDLVDHDHPAEPLQRCQWLLKALQVTRIFQVESLASRRGRERLSSKRRLARLSGAEQRHHRALPEERPDPSQQRRSGHQLHA